MRETQQRLLAEALIELAVEHPATAEELDREVPAYGLSLQLAWAVLTARSPGEVPPVYEGRHQVLPRAVRARARQLVFPLLGHQRAGPHRTGTPRRR
jgi:hypothetical protein